MLRIMDMYRDQEQCPLTDKKEPMYPHLRSNVHATVLVDDKELDPAAVQMLVFACAFTNQGLRETLEQGHYENGLGDISFEDTKKILTTQAMLDKLQRILTKKRIEE